MNIDTPGGAASPSPHPLACALARTLAPGAGAAARVLLLGFGSGRNVPALLDAQLDVDIVEPQSARALAAATAYSADARVRVVCAPYDTLGASGSYAGALSTHALLHGTVASVHRAIAALRDRLVPEAPFLTTLGSVEDPRYGAGRRVAPGSYAPLDGTEAGVTHAYFDEAGIRAALHGFIIEELVLRSAAETAGTWAHSRAEARTLRHYFVRARRAQ